MYARAYIFHDVHVIVSSDLEKSKVITMVTYLHVQPKNINEINILSDI